MGSERISVGRDGGIAHVELAREGKFNAMDKDMFAAIGDSFRMLGADPSVRAILLCTTPPTVHGPTKKTSAAARSLGSRSCAMLTPTNGTSTTSSPT